MDPLNHQTGVKREALALEVFGRSPSALYQTGMRCRGLWAHDLLKEVRGSFCRGSYPWGPHLLWGPFWGGEVMHDPLCPLTRPVKVGTVLSPRHDLGNLPLSVLSTFLHGWPLQEPTTEYLLG